MQLSKAKIKQLCSLQQKKFRLKSNLFIVEGEKMAKEVLQQALSNIEHIYATAQWIDNNSILAAQYKPIITIITVSELKKISSLKTPNHILIVLPIPTAIVENLSLQDSLCLALENIQDPGNMGTIIRIADWFGIEHLFCSVGCVDVYNPKVIQATMGGFLRIKIHYTDLGVLFKKYPSMAVYGAVLGGQNVFKTTLEKKGFLLIGNEGRGISEELQKQISAPITIPKYGQAESLNAAVATGILCALFQQ